MFVDFFDVTKPVGIDEVFVTGVIVVFCMWLGFRVLKAIKKKYY